MNVPEGALVSPDIVRPQHTAFPVVFTPQAESKETGPVLNWVKVPEGALVSPVTVTPQHVACPVVFTPQANK
jgi:hypothetical protein